jgi:hypothetical protein
MGRRRCFLRQRRITICGVETRTSAGWATCLAPLDTPPFPSRNQRCGACPSRTARRLLRPRGQSSAPGTKAGRALTGLSLEDMAIGTDTMQAEETHLVQKAIGIKCEPTHIFGRLHIHILVEAMKRPLMMLKQCHSGCPRRPTAMRLTMHCDGAYFWQKRSASPLHQTQQLH